MNEQKQTVLDVVTKQLGGHLAEDDAADAAKDALEALTKEGFAIVPAEQWQNLRGPGPGVEERTAQALREATAMNAAALDALEVGVGKTVPKDEVRAMMRTALRRVRGDFVEEHDTIAARLT